MEQQRQDEEELTEPPMTSGRANKEVHQTLRDEEDFIGTPKTTKRQHKNPDRYQALWLRLQNLLAFRRPHNIMYG